MSAAEELGKAVGIVSACDALGVPRSSLYLRRHPPKVRNERAKPPRALTTEERQRILDVLHSERFVDKAPGEAYATLLDEGMYLCSERTMYRILAGEDEVRERRNQVRHPSYQKPELLATKPRQVWSWDITKLRGPCKWTYYYLYVIIDIFSRYVVGWMVADAENAVNAEHLIGETCKKENIQKSQLIIHSDRGAPMKSNAVAQLMADLGVTKSLSRPSVSDDNPYSESQFKTLKYRPDFPKRFGSIQDAKVFCREFFRWYNKEHYHSGIGMMTPEAVHYGKAEKIWEERATVLLAAYKANPERFVRRTPVPPALPEAAWINAPTSKKESQDSQASS